MERIVEQERSENWGKVDYEELNIDFYIIFLFF